MKLNWKLLRLIFFTFLKMGPVTFGGGYALIPVIEREAVEKRKWLRNDELSDLFAVAQSVPGAVAINSAAFIGYRLAGAMGAVAAMTGILLPTFCIVVLLAVFFLQFKEHPKIEAAFMSVRATVVALITYAAIKIGKSAIFDKTTALLAGLTVALLLFGGRYIHPIILIVGGAAAGIAIVVIRKKWFGLETATEKKQLPDDKKIVYDYMI
ncbi:chromate transporter [Paenibacillus tarimensis]